jgi:hypothetical protein
MAMDNVKGAMDKFSSYFATSKHGDVLALPYKRRKRNRLKAQKSVDKLSETLTKAGDAEEVTDAKAKDDDMAIWDVGTQTDPVNIVDEVTIGDDDDLSTIPEDDELRSEAKDMSGSSQGDSDEEEVGSI